MIEVKLIRDSVNPGGSRLTTWLLTYPRFIHAEFMTHRVFSRNAASSRAIPIEKMTRAIETTPAWPERWGRKGKGMQDGGELETGSRELCLSMLERLKGLSVGAVQSCSEWGLAKQIANRYLEPWGHITVLATATDHDNFFSLRAHPAAQPEFQVLAYRMLAKYLDSEPQLVPWGEWHLPLLDYDGLDGFSIAQRLKIAVAQALRASYTAFEDGLASDRAFDMHDRATEVGHWSAFEHCAQAIDVGSGVREPTMGCFHKRPYPWSNFDYYSGVGAPCPSGWGQYRKLFGHENRTSADLLDLLAAKPDWITI